MLVPLTRFVACCHTRRMANQGVNRRQAAVPTQARANKPSGFLEWLNGALANIGEAAILAWQTILAIATGKVAVRDLVNQMAAIGADSLGIVVLITTATGAVFALYTSNLAVQRGFTQFVGGAIAYTILNELGPVLGGVALASRAGAAIAAEIGSMVVTEQVDALRAMAISPIRYLVAPRVLAAVLMLPLLTILADIAGLIGGFVTATQKGVPQAAFWESVRTFAVPADLNHGLVKALVFGFLVGLIACQQGLRTKGGATGVGRATTSSVVICVVLIFLSDYLLTQLLSGKTLGQ
jgi:phospholipid/cholesterol/gamma-HCH transport system permease protein